MAVSQGQDCHQPILEKSELVKHLRALMEETLAFLRKRGIKPEAIKKAEGFEKIALLDDAVERLIDTDETKKTYMGMALAVSRLSRPSFLTRRRKV